MAIDERFVTKNQEDFCKDCQFWVLPSMGANVYECRLGLKPRVHKGRLACRWKRKDKR